MEKLYMNQKLLEEISIDLESMFQIVIDVEALLAEVKTQTPNNIYKTALGGFAAQFYNGIENIMKRIHKAYNIDLPRGDNWHIVLLDRFSVNSDFPTPCKFSDELILSLTDYRRFRHYFFHGYGHNLNWDIISNAVSDINEVFNAFRAAILKDSPN